MVGKLIAGRFERSLPPDWDTAKRLWAESKAFFSAHGLSADEAYSLAMTTSELLENAIKYGDWKRAPDEMITVVAEVGGRVASVEVQGPVADDPGALKRLDEQIQWMRGFQSPFEAYVSRLKHLSGHDWRDGESGLGLIRIVYEARCLLDFYVTPEGRLSMSAVYQPQGLYAP
ncbi:MAG: ATP-binding protein [Myxococcota bacterium]